jgi:hypothetical protein
MSSRVENQISSINGQAVIIAESAYKARFLSLVSGYPALRAGWWLEINGIRWELWDI